MSSTILHTALRTGDDRLKSQSKPRLLLTGLVFGAIWLILAGPEDPSSWIIGLPAVVAAAWCYDALSPGRGSRLSVSGLAKLVPVFFWESFKGGIDVARRVVGPRVNVDPGFFDYRLEVKQPSARVFFVDLVSLLPGTLSADMQGDTLTVHTLDQSADAVAELQRLEQLVAAVFREGKAAPAP